MVNIVAITSKEFSDKRWHRFKLMKFAANDTVAPLSAHEASRAILSMPVGFIQKAGQFSLVALQGLESDHNLFVNQSGRWRGGYIPHHYFCYPFQMRKSTDGKLVLCIDQESELLSSKDDELAEEFFDEAGAPKKLVTDVAEFLSSHIVQLESTAKTCQLLAEHRLIKPWPLQVETSKGGIALEALYCIDEERLNSLSATALKELRNGDALSLAYAQLFSMLNVHLLVKQLDNSGQDESSAALSEISFESFDSDGTINFDNL